MATEPEPLVATEPEPLVATEPEPQVVTEQEPQAANDPESGPQVMTLPCVAYPIHKAWRSHVQEAVYEYVH